ncbi:hypothetical protein LTS16_020611 [Friedmanniomyces endolithicus]|uniref:Uncharacterized protein n=1 Tax=Friedmanniomyces endolithicus TaxID=329885 RepID=A0AAN6G0Z5_9PEZI|nr:hypothetical protein LTR35_002358 [Friedmanniomyces endolithicus]KAK0295880.1 hypothetical protein LTS00_005621 [Friedmanniomyces endolithicus]KAK0325851.1 hypothetical protein LTR82_003390 [Friedmanniomyces endolithicus]KAK0914964.1 hypothetical protein LTR57_013763 [Friedmanniomyces endolithicus]KAK0979923.1 hypothetical protein LTS01_012291 [Friedmanniomyces endolithicus]
MRMKDSDDYITARAANPWTGVVSPSVGSPSPRTPEPAAEPAAYSKRKLEPPTSPTPVSPHARPALSRANEGRKVSAGSFHRWRTGVDMHGWVSEAALGSPRETNATAGASVMVRSSGIGGDRFVVQMPSAREPQPYFYPGCSAAEIKALEDHKLKTRKVSREECGGVRLGSGSSLNAAAGVRKMGDIRVAKRQAHGGGRSGHHEPASTPGPEPTAATFAPFASPHTPSTRTTHAEPTVLKTVHRTAPHRDDSPYPAFEPGPLRRKPVGSPPLSSSNLTHLLPRVRLVHPELASYPYPPPSAPTSRLCSLGCEREIGTGECHDNPSRPLPHPARQLFPDPAKSPSVLDNQDPTAQILAAAVTYAVQKCQDLRFPDTSLLWALRAPDASPQQKIDGLRALLSLGAQVLAVLMVISALWRLGVAVAGVVEVVFWPFVVPFRILRWVVKGEGGSGVLERGR